MVGNLEFTTDVLSPREYVYITREFQKKKNVFVGRQYGVIKRTRTK